jgi:myo-inositol-1(or 4)-monophosphatase
LEGATAHGRVMRDAAALVVLAVQAARAAARVHRAGIGRAHTVTTKSSPTDMVTEVDHEAERTIVDAISAVRPDDAIIAEESGARAGTSGVRWIVDPLDGTTNYVYRYPAFSVSIGIEIDGTLAAGVVHDTARDRVYTGIVGAGAACNGTPIAVRDHADLATALVATGFQPQPERRAWQAHVLTRVLPRIRDVRRGGSAAIDLSAVASGQVDAFFEAGLAEWDMAAGVAIVRAAGGVVEVVGRDAPPTPVVVAAGPRLIEPLVECLREAGLFDARQSH